jgi:hypothetical protein
MNEFVRQRLLVAWLAALTVGVGYAVWRPVSAARTPTAGRQIDVERINLREPDGTLRMVISNTASAPGYIVKGTEHVHPSRKSAGILFFNDEGTENGGLIFDGATVDGKVSGSGHLSFDQYEQDQVVSLEQTEEDGRRRAGLAFFDRPDGPLPVDLIDRAQTPVGQRELDALVKAHGFGVPRVFVGKSEDRASTLLLRDDQGRVRLKLMVTHDGAASIEFIDADGKPVKRIAADQ